MVETGFDGLKTKYFFNDFKSDFQFNQITYMAKPSKVEDVVASGEQLALTLADGDNRF